ncbi:hypothetical protein RclHR1_00100043 [Rhizophagus clarus]|uniref:Probable long-chain-alcohol O-fatty-acyltransferase 4 n=1 Tax=Rhizophagus clarus TaxID=94130 RepID=A0A2Z6QC35_9GLOM|nr:hypothetical protein RclHR1_00100043 [Rhizophagus clarus]GES93614.1 probable long-chain-alcohol O-fatty-acyltransferase 4 [Rhizophagus clarus]
MISFQEFPPKLSLQILQILFLFLIFIFVALSLEPPKSLLRYIILINIIISLLALPIIYRGKYEEYEIVPLTLLAFGWSFKMMIWLKKCLYAEKEKQIGPFYLTMFYWRKPSKKTNKRQEMTIKNIYIYISQRIILIFFKWVLFEILYRWVTNNIPEIPEGIYPVRIFNWITKGIPALTPFLIFYYGVITFFVTIMLSIGYDLFLIINGILLRYLITLNEGEEFLFFEKQHTRHIKEWCISMMYDTNHMFIYPYLSTSPRDLWSFRWQLFLNGSFKELAYLPARNIFINKSKKLGDAIGVLAAFTMSAILHEYIIFVFFNKCSGDNLFFFILHGIIFVIWEGVIGSTKETEEGFSEEKITMKKILRWSIMLMIILFTIPGFAEPYVRHHRWVASSVFTSYKRDPSLNLNITDFINYDELYIIYFHIKNSLFFIS